MGRATTVRVNKMHPAAVVPLSIVEKYLRAFTLFRSSTVLVVSPVSGHLKSGYAAERRIVDEHCQLHFDVCVALVSPATYSFPRPTKPACYSNGDQHLQEGQH